VTLRQKIEQEIREHGPIPFSRYMELCLHDPELGYYSRNAEQFGKAGDFYTSSDVHAVFGRLMARQFEEMWRVLGSPDTIEILELGPGRGLFAQDVLDWSEKKFPEFFTALHYSLAERSPALRRRLQANLGRHFAAGKASLCSENSSATREGTASAAPKGVLYDSASAAKEPRSVPVIVFANEFFDALPVEVLSSQGELRISHKDGRLLETWNPASPGELEFLDRHGVHPEAGERIEAPLIAQRYMSQIASAVKRGFIIVIDYGYTRQEQLAGRHRGTITAYRRHSVSANPYEAPGEQDITAQVNFTALAAAAEEQGMLAQPLLTQSQFLLGIGEPNQFADAFEECRLPQERAKVALQLKHLVTPAGVGESFQVLIASKGVSTKQVAKLSGLSFGKTEPPIRESIRAHKKLS
jgi:SAM-dependent MidA family methyltransferase